MNNEVKDDQDHIPSGMLELIPVIYLNCDKEGHIRYVNSWARETFGNAIHHKTLEGIFPQPLDLNTIDGYTKTPETPIHFNIPTVSGSFQTYLFHFISIAGGFVVLGYTDVEELENLERQVTEMNTELTALNRQIQKKNAELSRLNTLKNQFLGMAAHDLRNPCSIIHIYANLLLTEAGNSLSDEQKDILKTIIDSSSRMGNIVDDFLDISIIEAGKVALSREEIDLMSFMSDFYRLQKLQAEAVGVKLALTFLDEVPLLYLDRSKIEQVMTNLVSNALEHSPRESRVDIDIKKTEKEVIISVKDRGPGISEDMIGRLFDPYEKSQTAGKRDGVKSSGLGLTIAAKIIESHQGRIWVDSKVGSGTTFSVALPLLVREIL